MRALCERLVDDLTASGRVVHLFFDCGTAAREWQSLSPRTSSDSESTSSQCRASVLGEGGMEADDGVLILVSPDNRGGFADDGTRLPADALKLDAVQSLVCGARHRPVSSPTPQL